MKKVTELRSRNLRQNRNSELVRRMQTGEQLTSFNSFSSWYPPRPIIEKNQVAIQELYGKSATALQNIAKADDVQKESDALSPLQIAN